MDTDQNNSWAVWFDAVHNPYANMAIDEAVVRTAADRGRCLLRFYHWDRPSASIGYMQHAKAVGDPDTTVVRRPTGGGVVWHDRDITYSVAAPPTHLLTTLDKMESYNRVNQAVQQGLRYLQIEGTLTGVSIGDHVNRREMACFENPTKYDILFNGQKIAGSAQRRTGNGLLHQGSILLPEEASCNKEEVMEVVLRGFKEVFDTEFPTFSPEPALSELASELEETQYSQESWNFRR